MTGIKLRREEIDTTNNMPLYLFSERNIGLSQEMQILIVLPQHVKCTFYIFLPMYMLYKPQNLVFSVKNLFNVY